MINTINKLNPTEIKIDGNKIVTDLAKYHFIVDGLLFSSAISNDTNNIFITGSSLNDTKQAFINDKLHLL